jgi:AcrR family transcriptional regulator
MFIEMKKRKYTQKRRAEQQARTRAEIVEAAMTLHEELGPAGTSIKAVAERAGVQRATVYRYFPDDHSLFEACTSHWLALHPPPVEADWSAIQDAGQLSHAALLAFCRYYRSTEQMWQGAYRDVEQVAALQGPMAQFEAYLDQVRDNLLAAWEAKGARCKRLSVTLRHGLRFSSWQSLRREGLGDRQIADLLLHWLQAD